jgi:predicted nucleotidyltransferase
LQFCDWHGYNIMIHPFLQEKLPVINDLLHRYQVKRAYAFGSVCTPAFNENSDIDLLISFREGLEPADEGEKWWDLYYSLKKYLNREVDLVTEKSLRNPYFISEVNATKEAIYGQ